MSCGLLPTAPPMSDNTNVMMNFNDDLTLLNRQRMRRVSEIINELKQTCIVYNKKSAKLKRSTTATNIVKNVCNFFTVPSVGVTLIFPTFAFVTVPVALTGTGVLCICDVHQSRTVAKRGRYDRVATAAKCCQENIEHVLKNVLLDGIVTEQEYELAFKCYDSFKDVLKSSKI